MSPNRTSRSLYLAAVAVVFGFGARADTYVSGTIATDTTWTLANSPYVVTGDLNVAGTSSPTLTIQPGVVVKVQATRVISVGYLNPGRLIALGTSGQPIVFTTDQVTVTAGYWRGLFLVTSATPSSQLSYVAVEGGGYNAYGQHAGLYISAGSPSLDHITLRTSNWAALTVAGGTPTVTNSTLTGTTGGDGVGIDLFSPAALAISGTSITGNAGGAIAMRNGTALSNTSGMTVSGNGNDAVLYRDSTITQNQTWKSFGIPYIPDTEIYVTGTATPVLTLEAGVTVKMRGGSKAFAVGDVNPGRLIAVGTPSQPILFSTFQTPATAGYWRGLFLVSGGLPSSQLAYVTVEGGGYYAYSMHSGIHLYNGAPTLDHVTVRTSNWAALTVGSGTPTVTYSTLSGTTGGDGLGVEVLSGTLTMSDTAITSNAGAPLALSNGSVLSGMTGMTYAGNGLNAIRYRSATIATSETWKNFGLPYIPDTEINVSGTTTPVLTIEAGVTVKMHGGAKVFAIGYPNPGRLVAIGTAGQPILISTDQATVTPGYWRGLFLVTSATPSSQLAYVTVEGGGYNVYGQHSGLYISAGSPSLDHVTVRTSNWAALTVAGGTPTVTNSTLTGTTGGDGLGVDFYSGTLAISNTAITNNAGAPFALSNGFVLTGMTGMTYSGNAISAIRYRSATIATSETWNNFGLPYYPDSGLIVGANGSPVLTLGAGVTVKFRSASYIQIGSPNPGRLIANGTQSQPILLTTDQTTVTPGYYYGASLSSSAQSQLTYVTIEGGGKNTTQAAGLKIFSGNHALDHVTLRTNAYAGLMVAGGSPTVTNSTINGTTVSPGAGVDIYAGSPVIFATTISGNVTGIRGGGGAPTITNCTISGNTTGAASTISNYVFKASLNYWGDATGPNAGPGTGTGNPVTGIVRYDPFLVAAPVFTQYMTAADLVERKFNPADGHRGTWTLGSSAPGNWTLAVKNASNSVVRTLTASGSPASMVWDGKNGSGIDQPDGNYTYQLDNVAGGNAATSASGRVFLDRTLAYVITSPGATATVSNVYQNGSADVAVIGSASSANLSSWILESGNGTAPATWTTLATSTSSVSNGTLATWATYPLTNGLFTLRLTLYDTLLNCLVASITPTVGNFKISNDVLQFNAASGGQVIYTSTVPFSLTETIYIKTWSGTPVRTLLSALRPAGTYNDPWNASADPDGAYLYTVGIDDGAGHTMTVDQSNQFINGFSGYNDSLSFSAYDPFNNQPLLFSFNFAQPGAVTLAFSPTSPVPNNCNPPNFCLLNRAILESGPHPIVWAGTDGTGVFRPDIKSVGVVIDQTTFPKNGVVVYGRRPVVSNVRVTPPNYGPVGGSQTVSFSLATYQNQPAAVTVAFLNQGSLSTLRTITVPSQAPGNVNVTWDGKAADGSFVAPGAYTVTASATDALGNVGTGQILTRLGY